MAGTLPGLSGPVQAQQQPKPLERPAVEDLGGRWKSRATGQSVDFVRCGEGWCGIRVGEGGRCGDVALRFTVSDTPPLPIALTGRFDLRVGADTLNVHGKLYRIRETGERFIGMSGFSGDRARVTMSRSFPYSDRWSRIGEVTCSIEGKVS
jgi:hypothetical protein